MNHIKVPLEEVGSRAEHIVERTVYVTGRMHRAPVCRATPEPNLDALERRR